MPALAFIFALLLFHAINALENMLLFYYVINYSYRDHHDRDIRI
jgi:hypothetical protein